MTLEAIWLLRQLTDINFVGFDLVEVLPAYDSAQITSSLAANLIFEMICLIALLKKED
jgi:agmatinase